MKVLIEADRIIITVPRDKNPELSSTGKSRLLYSSKGIIKADTTFEGFPVSIGLNVMVSVKKPKQEQDVLGKEL